MGSYWYFCHIEALWRIRCPTARRTTSRICQVRLGSARYTILINILRLAACALNIVLEDRIVPLGLGMHG